ncbi:MAG TPA: glycosyltransferase family 4 protein [Candidatus Thermoplasmatota archaeon]|nr:glycosyltransferase family 4 protein [Candidatus Thermoplasmatota archaeon]
MSDPTVVFTARLMPPAALGGLERFSADVLEALRAEFEVRDLANYGGKASQWRYLATIRHAAKKAVRGVATPVVDASDASLAFAAAASGAPSVLRVHGLDLLFPNPAYQFLLRKHLPRVSRVVANSGPTSQLLNRLRIPEERLSIVHPAAEAPPGWTPAPVPGRILMVGRLVARKGVVPFIEDIWPRLCRDLPQSRLDVAGDGSEREAVDKAVASAPEKGRITLHGRASQPLLESLYREADVLVLNNQPSKVDFEGFGIVAAEAASRGIPVVANRLDGVVDAVLPGRTGILVEAGDPAAMADAVAAIVRRQALGNRTAIQEAAGQRWSKARLRSQYAAIVREVAESHAPA